MNKRIFTAVLLASAAIAIPAMAQPARDTTEAARIAQEKTGFVYKLDPTARKPNPANYKAPRLPWGAPDLGGDWGNTTLTQLERRPEFGTRNALTDAEVAKIEGADQAIKALSEKPTDPKATTQEVSKQADCSGGRGTGCNYNQGFVDFGGTVVRVNGEPRASMITFPADGRIPPRIDGRANARGFAASEEGAAQEAQAAAGARRQGQNDNPEGRSRAERCLQSFGQQAGPIMMPALYNNTYRIQQGTDTVAIEVEMVHDVRLIRLNSKHRTDGIRPYMGDSIGWYEGDTLVIETTNYPAYTNLRGSSANLKVTERLKRVSPTRMLYQFKVEDPTVWAQPWGGEYEFSATEPLFEYACHEGNYGLEDILAGAREEERQAAEKAGQQANAGR
ncbi:MAG TPA: hypothetical protein VFN88_05920 [Caulobacteraceae bacterium]|nr:hypothetical protein [Caulobacteraceae bacterium]